MLRLDGDEVCALTELGLERRQQGIAPHCSSYVSVEDANVTVARARELGATVHGDAFDVFDAGRMAVIQDPAGAVFAIWQPGYAHRRAGSTILVGCPETSFRPRIPRRRSISTPASSTGRWSLLREAGRWPTW